MSLKKMVQGVVLAEQQGQDITNLIATLANMPNVDNLDGSGIPLPYGVDAITKMVNDGRASALKALEKSENDRKRKALIAAQEALKVEVSGIDFDIPEMDTFADIYNRVTALDAYIVVVMDESGNPTFTVSGLKAPKGGNKGGGKPAKDQPRPFVSVETGERVIGGLPDWARANVDADFLAHAKYTDADEPKLRGGKVLETFLTNEHKVDGKTFGPFLKRDSGEDFAADFEAWEAARNSTDDTAEDSSEDTDTEE